MPSGERLPLVWMPWPLSIRIFMVLSGTALRFRDKGNKKYEFQLQAAGTRFSLIYSAAGRYGASQIHYYFRQRYNFFINAQFYLDKLTGKTMPVCVSIRVFSDGAFEYRSRAAAYISFHISLARFIDILLRR